MIEKKDNSLNFRVITHPLAQIKQSGLELFDFLKHICLQKLIIFCGDFNVSNINFKNKAYDNEGSRLLNFLVTILFVK